MNNLASNITFSAIGDTCVDVYPQQQTFFCGGTAYNSVLAAKKAGAMPTLLSAVGNDVYGKSFITELKKRNLSTDYVQLISGETSQVTVTLDESHSPTFSNWKLGVLEKFHLSEKDELLLQTQKIARIIFLKPLAHIITEFCKINLPQTLKAIDLVGGSEYSPEVKAFEPFESCFDVIFRSCDISDKKELQYLQSLAQRKKIVTVGLLGKAGSVVFHNNQTYQQSSHATKVVDTTGAGDTYITNFLIEFVKMKNIEKAMKKATEAAAQIITHLGAT